MSEDPGGIDIRIAWYDRNFAYGKLQIAFDTIWFHRRAFLVQTNPDRFCPFPGGRGELDCAAITAAIDACTGTTGRRSLGKPDQIMLWTVMSTLPGATVARTVMVADRLQTDIKMELFTDMVSAVILTDEATADDVAALPRHLTLALGPGPDRPPDPRAHLGRLGWSESDPD